MSVSGLALTAFLLFHGGMNLTLVFSEEVYNTICRLLGANWYALVGSMVIGFLVLVHFSFAMLLGHKNAIARGKSKYEVNIRQKGVISSLLSHRPNYCCSSQGCNSTS